MLILMVEARRPRAGLQGRDRLRLGGAAVWEVKGSRLGSRVGVVTGEPGRDVVSTSPSRAQTPALGSCQALRVLT